MFKIYKMNIEAWKIVCATHVEEMLKAEDRRVYSSENIEECKFYDTPDGGVRRIFNILEEVLEDPMIPDLKHMNIARETLVEFYEALELADMSPLDYSTEWKDAMTEDEVRIFYYDIIDDIFSLLAEAIEKEEHGHLSYIMEIFKHNIDSLCEFIKNTERGKHINFKEFKVAFKDKEEVEE